MSSDEERSLPLNRRELLLPLATAGAAALIAPSRAASPQPKPNEPGPYDLVIRGGLAVDPETGLEARRTIGIKGNRIAAISDMPLKGSRTLDAEGLVVAPGFIDLHAHGQQLPAAWVQAFDGVTTALELESGILPIGRFYDLIAKEGRPINYGASAAWTYARIAEKEGVEPDGTIAWFQQAFSLNKWQNSLADDAELARIIERVRTGLREGGLGIGINAGYAPGYGRMEYHALAKLAAAEAVPTFTHVRYLSVIEPQSSFEALAELVAMAAATGCHMHVCHLNSIAARDAERCADLLKQAINRGLPITVEAYPYGASSTTVGAEMFRMPDWLERYGARSAADMELNGKPMTQAKIDELQKSAPGTPIVMHFLRPDKEPTDQALLDLSVLFPGAAIASDAMPWAVGNTLVEGDAWPLPKDAFAHPRSTGCYARFIGQYVRDRKMLSLRDAMAKCSLIPARILEISVPQMRAKGRLQVGADADLVVFDLATIRDEATFLEPARLSRGFAHVVVNGTPIIVEGRRIGDARPGRPIRRGA